MQIERHERFSIQSEHDVVLVRQAVRKWAGDVKFSVVEQTKLITAASELTRNTLIHGKGGSALLELVNNDGRQGLRISFEDNGPGIPNIDMALTDGYTTGGGLGLGLSGSKRLVNEFHIDSEVGKGTRVVITHWRYK